jgi:flagellar operon protein
VSFRIQNGQVIPSQVQRQKASNTSADFEKAFIDALKQKDSQVKVSAHAQNRMDERQIALSDEDMNKIKAAVDELGEKGARESLLLYKNSAFIASISNRTIITAMNGAELGTVTNIDSAVSIK